MAPLGHAIDLLKSLLDVHRLFNVEVQGEEEDVHVGVQLEILNDRIRRDLTTSSQVSTRIDKPIVVVACFQFFEGRVVLLESADLNLSLCLIIAH